MSRSSECRAVVGRVEDLAALTAHHAQLEEPHLVVCADCREQVAGTRDVLAGLDALPVRAPRLAATGTDLADRVMMRLSAAPAPVWAAKRAPVAQAPAVVSGRSPVQPRVEPRRPVLSEPAPGFFERVLAVLTLRNLAAPAMGLAVVLFALVAIKPAGQQVAHTRTPASPIVEEPELIESGTAGVALSNVQGEVTAFTGGAWKPVSGSVAAGQRVQVGRGGRVTMTLPDGSKIDVGGDTEVVAFAERFRVRHGHARFDVMHRPERTFRVLVPDGEVRVLGTLFDVDAATAGTRVHLLHGRIEIQCATQVERLEDGDSATIGSGKLTRLAAADRAGAEPLSSSTPAHADGADAGEATAVPAGDPRPAVQATAASGPAPQGLK